MNQKPPVDYRVNYLPDGRLLSVEITCCGQYTGEIRFADGQSLTCSRCGTRHVLHIQHNHFHLRQFRNK
ncbi:hypothetical protein NZJ93_08585 [Desulfofundulus thermocisternus]|nr:hypothetical protein [Desulfofundulus australicus]MCS5696144.1 hypothetical protein [Desulfofundulus thermocisternus]